MRRPRASLERTPTISVRVRFRTPETISMSRAVGRDGWGIDERRRIRPCPTEPENAGTAPTQPNANGTPATGPYVSGGGSASAARAPVSRSEASRLRTRPGASEGIGCALDPSPESILPLLCHHPPEGPSSRPGAPLGREPDHMAIILRPPGECRHILRV